jgi:hypothetical protein
MKIFGDSSGITNWFCTLAEGVDTFAAECKGTVGSVTHKIFTALTSTDNRPMVVGVAAVLGTAAAIGIGVKVSKVVHDRIVVKAPDQEALRASAQYPAPIISTNPTTIVAGK